MAKYTFIKTKIYSAILLLFGIIAFGTIGYILIADFNFLDAIYMTILTLSTVGFREVQPLDDDAKVFTISLILTSVLLYGYILSAITEYISNNQLFQELKIKKVQKKINNLTGHTIVCGYGRNGKQAVARLISYNQPCVVIENRNELIEDLDKNDKIMHVKGDATDDEALLRAGIKQAKHLITTLPSDADNLFVVLSARQLNKTCTIISRASNDSSYTKLKIAGADNVIMPDRLGGGHMASLVVTPDLLEFIERLSLIGEEKNSIIELPIEVLPSEFRNKSILDLDLRRKSGCTVVGLKTTNKEYMINPDGNTLLEPGSKLIVIGKPEQIKKLNEIF
jgi:voltage-gated potassium channel